MDAQLALLLDRTRPALDFASLCDAEERSVARALRWGRAAARQVDEIAREVEIPGRRVQDVVQHLLFEHGWPIGTSMAEPYGNYLIDSAQELEHTVELLRTRGITSLARAAALRRMTLERYLHLVQTELVLRGAR